MILLSKDYADEEKVLDIEIETEEHEPGDAEPEAIPAQEEPPALILDESGEEEGVPEDVPEEDAETALLAKLEAARQAVYAAKTAAEAQRAVACPAEAALLKAQEEYDLAEQRKQEAAAELMKLRETQEQAAENIDESKEMASLTAQKAGGEEELALARRVTFIAARELEAQAALEEEQSCVQLEAAQSSADEAAASLLALEQELDSAKESARLLMEEAAEKNIPLSEEMQAFFAEELMPPAPDAPVSDTDEKAKKPGFWKTFWSYSSLVAFAVLLALALRVFVFDFTLVEGESMINTLHDRDKVITVKIGYLFGSPKRGDIVILHPPNQENEYYIKRVIGLPGDTIELRDGKVYINEKLLDEPYLEEGVETWANLTYGNMTLTVPEGHYFVIGDNRGNSRDSRNPAVGLIERGKIKGKAVFRFLPFDSFGGLYN